MHTLLATLHLDKHTGRQAGVSLMLIYMVSRYRGKKKKKKTLRKKAPTLSSDSPAWNPYSSGTWGTWCGKDDVLLFLGEPVLNLQESFATVIATSCYWLTPREGNPLLLPETGTSSHHFLWVRFSNQKAAIWATSTGWSRRKINLQEVSEYFNIWRISLTKVPYKFSHHTMGGAPVSATTCP